MKQFVAITLFSLLAASAVAQQQSPRAPREQIPPGAREFVRGQQAVKKWNADEAIRNFERALDINPDLILSHYYLGYAYQKKMDWDKAGENFEQFLRNVNDDDPKAHQLVFHATRQGGLALAQTDNFRRAIPYLQATVTAKPKDKEAHFYLGVALSKDQNLAKAETHLKKVIELDDDYAEAYYHLGRISYGKDDADPTRRYIEKFLEMAPKSPHAAESHFMLGSLALKDAEVSLDSSEARAEAKAQFEKYLELEPEGERAEEVKKQLVALEETSG